MRRAAESSWEGVRDGTSKVSEARVERMDCRRCGGVWRRCVVVASGSVHGRVCGWTMRFRTSGGWSSEYPYLPRWFGVEPCGVGVPHEQVRSAKVNWNIVAIDRKYRRFLDVVTSSSPDVRVEREHRDIRRLYRHMSIEGGRHSDSTQSRHLRQQRPSTG